MKSGSSNLILITMLILSACTSASMEAMNAGNAQGAEGGTQGFIFGTLYFILMAFFAYFFLVIKPQQVEEEERKKFVSNLKKGTEVCTTGGLIGKVTTVNNDVVSLEIAPKIVVQVKSNYIEKDTSQNKNA